MAQLEGELLFDSAGDDPVSSGTTSSSSTDDAVSPPPPHTSSAKSMNVPVRSRVKFYTSLCEYPIGVSFDTQDSDEEIILLIRRSFITNVPWMSAIFFLALIPPLLFLLPLSQYLGGLSPLTYIVAITFFYLMLFGGVLVNFALWYFHVGLITNKRVIDVDLHGILSRHVAETRISLVQDVSYQQVGFIRSLFHFGDVYLQTAGSEQNFEFDRIPQPRFVAQVVGDLLGRPFHEKKK